MARVVPALLFAWPVAKGANSLVQVLVAGPGADPLVFWAHVLQRAAVTAFMGACALLFLVRRRRTGPRTPQLGRVVALAGTWGMTFPLASAQVVDLATLLLVSSALMVGGMVWSLVSIAHLGRCFGLLPEARGLVTSGPYRWVRHPIYLGEIVAMVGMVLATQASALFLLVGLWTGVQYWRARLEERALEREFSEYAAYRARTWRMIPGVD